MTTIMRDVRFQYPSGDEVLSELSLEVPKSARIALMGPSGSGKSTILKMLAGLPGYEPSHGSISRESHFTMVFQSSLLLDHLSVRDNIALPSLLARESPDVDQVATDFELLPHLDKYPFQLSGGQQRRVALARALGDPNARCFAMDEPFSGLDEPLRDRLIGILERQFSMLSCTVIFSTHSAYEACALADKVLFLGGSPSAIRASHTVQIVRETRSELVNTEEFFHESKKIKEVFWSYNVCTD